MRRVGYTNELQDMGKGWRTYRNIGITLTDRGGGGVHGVQHVGLSQ